MPDEKKCAHQSCRCPAAEDSDYCSQYCEAAGAAPDQACACGHPDCSPVGKL